MTEIEKLRALLPHWIEHNRDHAVDFGRWADTAAQAGHQAAADLIRQAMQGIQQAMGNRDQLSSKEVFVSPKDNIEELLYQNVLLLFLSASVQPLDPIGYFAVSDAFWQES